MPMSTETASVSGARLVFVDNLYQLGPQNVPRTEDMPLSSSGQKAAILSEVTRMRMAAADRVRVAAPRCTDFYGPGVTASHLGPTAFGAIARGRPALLLAPPDIPHGADVTPYEIGAAPHAPMWPRGHERGERPALHPMDCAISHAPAATLTTPIARATNSPLGAKRSTVIATVTNAITRRSITPTTSRIVIKPAQQQLQ